MGRGLTCMAVVAALAACGGRDVGPVGPTDSHPRLRLLSCTAATPPPVLADDGVSFGGLTKAEILELKRSARQSRSPQVVIGTPSATGLVDKGVLARVIRSEIGSLRACYERSLASNPSLNVRSQIAFTVEADGRVSNVSVAGATPVLGQCLSGILGRLRFPALSGGGTVRVSYPLTFDHAGAPGLPPPSPSPEIIREPAVAPPPVPWTPYALDGSPALDVAPAIARSTEVAVRARLDHLGDCFTAPAPTGSLRAMLELDAGGELRAARIGGLGDATTEACLRRAFAGMHVRGLMTGGVEVACDLSRGDAQRWRVTAADYEVITTSRTQAEHAGQKLSVGASDPEALPGNRTYLVIAAPDTPGTVLELALAWAFEGDATLIATPRAGAAPELIGVGRSTFALGDAHDDVNALDVSLELYADRIAVCVQQSADEAPLSNAKAVAELLANVAARCRASRCASTVGLAIDGEAKAGALGEIMGEIRRAGFERVLIGSELGCRK